MKKLFFAFLILAQTMAFADTYQCTVSLIKYGNEIILAQESIETGTANAFPVLFHSKVFLEIMDNNSNPNIQNLSATLILDGEERSSIGIMGDKGAQFIGGIAGVKNKEDIFKAECRLINSAVNENEENKTEDDYNYPTGLILSSGEQE